MIAQTPAQVMADAVSRFGCVVWEVRLQMPGFKRTPRRVRVVVQCPDGVTKSLLAAVVAHAGGTVEGNPVRLGLGVPLPDGEVLSFSFPWEDAAQGLFELSPP